MVRKLWLIGSTALDHLLRGHEGQDSLGYAVWGNTVLGVIRPRTRPSVRLGQSKTGLLLSVNEKKGEDFGGITYA